MSRQRMSWAIVVGINDYPERASQRPLEGAVADAADFADWALHADGGAVPQSRLRFWTYPAPELVTETLQTFLAAPSTWWDPDGEYEPDFSRPPSGRNVVETALREARAAKAAALEAEADGEQPPLRRCYVFFAGHGVQSFVFGAQNDPQACYVLGDFRPDAQGAEGLVPCGDFKRALLSGGFDEVVMFLDCCRVEVTKLDMGVPAISTPPTAQPGRPVYVIGSAAQMGEPAFETVGAPVRGAFSRTLLEGLRTVRTVEGELLTFESLRAYVNDNIHAASQPNQQSPSFEAKPDNPYPHIAEGPALPAPVLVPRGGAAAGAPAAAPAPVAEAIIRIRFIQTPPGQLVQLVNGDGDPIGAPMDPADGEAERLAPIGKLYALDVLGTTISHPFRHPGPDGPPVEAL